MLKTRLRSGFLIGLACIALAACTEEDVNSPTPGPQTGTPSTPVAPPANVAPVITGTPATTAVSGTAYNFQASATDSDSTTLTFSATGLPDWANINAQTGMVSGTPTDDDAGDTADIIVSVSDGQTSASLPVFRVTVAALPAPPPPAPAPGNVAPSISGSPAISAQATVAYTFTPTASDPDSTRLTFSITNRPTWASFSTTTGRLTGTPTNAQVRSYSGIVIRVSDGALTTALPAFSINVIAAPNRAPTISGTPAASVAAGAAYSFTPTASDPDGQTLGYTITNKPSWATFSTANGRIAGTPGSANVGAYPGIVVSVSDGTATVSLPAFAITVSAAANGAPTISGSPAAGVIAGSAYSFTPTAADPNSDPLTFSITGRPTWAAFNTSTGALTGTPTTAQIGSYANVVITVTDGTTPRSLAAFSINVTSPGTGSGTATLSWTAPTQNTDGSALTQLGGYRIYHGTSANALTDAIPVTNPGVTTYVVSNLASGTHYFAVSAYTAGGIESAMSTVGSKTIP